VRAAAAVSIQSHESRLFDLFGRYRSHLAFHWRRRHSVLALRLTRAEAEFYPPTLALEERPVSPTLRITALMLIVLVSLAVTWASVGQVDIVAKATGKVIPSERTKTIASIDTASVVAIHVAEGQLVKSGELLIELDATPLEADRDKARGDESFARLTVARSRALLAAIEDGRPPRLASSTEYSTDDLHQAQRQLDAQYHEFAAKLAQVTEEIKHYVDALPVAVEREEIFKSLLAQRDVSTDAWLEKKQARLDIEAHLADARSSRASLVAQTKREALDAAADATKVAANSKEDEIHAAAHARLLTLRSPEDGTVQQLSVHTLGGVVEAAQPLMLIVPSSNRVEVEASVPDRDIGFVQLGQYASVKVAAFEYTKYGTLSGVVDSISHDAVEDKDHQLSYLIRVLLDRSTIDVNGHATQLIPGMSVDVDIKTGRRRVIDYLLSPLLRHQRESLHER